MDIETGMKLRKTAQWIALMPMALLIGTMRRVADIEATTIFCIIQMSLVGIQIAGLTMWLMLEHQDM